MHQLVKLLEEYPSVFVVCDKNAATHLGTLGLDSYPCKFITADEEAKTFESVIGICRWLLEQEADRNALLVGVGGGITTDMAGFAACIYKRGIRYANVPTTLLGQVDAGHGGKTGVNLDSYKNMIGIIRRPEFTHIDVRTLATLPEEEFLGGAAEMLKTFIINNEDGNYEKTVELLSGAKGSVFSEWERLGELIRSAASIKEGIVERDLMEKGERRMLNLGHTYAHAIEWFEHTNKVANPMSHGKAVAVGIICAARLSEDLGVAEKGLEDRLAADFRACGLPVELPYDKALLEKAIRKDKKAEDGKMNFVLIEKIGKTTVRRI